MNSPDLPTLKETDSVYNLHLPRSRSEIPLLVDSPHSGTLFPPGFRTLAEKRQLLTAWDAWVEELWQGVVSAGGSLLEARFPRVVIDPNRADDDIDPELLEESWPGDWHELSPTAYSERGMGLIRRLILPDRPMYEKPLSLKEVRWRLDALYYPYHRALQDRLGELHRAHGQVWHIDCHSMKSTGNKMNIDAGVARPDIVLGDRDGSSCEPGLMDLVTTELASAGLTVARNNPYKGGHIVAHYGKPDRGFHSMQVEINRAVYMDEAKFEKSRGFPELQEQLKKLCGKIAEYIGSRLG